MIVTESGAKTRWCPFARMLVNRGAGFGTYNRASNPEVPTPTCIGSQCMAWRTIPIQGDEPGGYCGAAGKP